MMIELRGAPVAAAISEKCRIKTEQLAAKGITPKLAIIRVGEKKDDISYEKNAVKRFSAVNAETETHILSEDVSQNEAEELILSLNSDRSVHGILILRPLPPQINEERIKRLIDPAKDADCMCYETLGELTASRDIGMAPCTPLAVMEILDHYGIELTGKKVTVVGRSSVVGLPLAVMLIKRNATVTVCHTKTLDLSRECSDADILIAAAGRAGIIGADCISEGQILIDVGINFKDGKICGDIDHDAAVLKAAAATPVPGGVGAVTTSVLLKQTVDSASKLC